MTAYESGVRNGSPDYEAKVVNALHVYAEHDDMNALFFLGVRYKDGKGLPFDLEKASSYFKRAADLGDATAAWFFADFCEGKAVHKTDTYAIKAVQYYLLAANNEDGCVLSLMALSDCYRRGFGVEVSAIDAFNYDLKASLLGDQDSYLDSESTNVVSLYRIGKRAGNGVTRLFLTSIFLPYSLYL